ncbi:MAG: mannose-6-phosphate isomerase, class I [bacterium]
MNKFYAKPYKLCNKIQNYAWGTRNGNALIPKLLGIEPVPDLPYAELWIGAHPKAPSEIEIEGRKVTLDKVIEKFPDECLGEYVNKKFNSKFPFLLKVLSAAEALSIQLHPNKAQAEILHAKDPVNYPDDNHKPEIAIAIDSLTAIAGFKPIQQIKSSLSGLSELADFIDVDLISAVINSSEEKEAGENVQALYSAIMKKTEDVENLTNCINKICDRLSKQELLSLEETQFLKQHELYGADVGLFSFFFFNLLKLKPGQAIFTDAGVPHAYIAGNIIECMANSDNVVRAGLTNKFKDVDTLLEIVKYDFKEFEIINEKQETDEIGFKTTAEEFELTAIQSENTRIINYHSNDKPSIIQIMNGKIRIEWTDDESHYENLNCGDAIFFPASLNHCKLTLSSGTKYFMVNIP